MKIDEELRIVLLEKQKQLIEEWIDNFEVTSQSVGDLEQQYEDLLREKTEQQKH